jgi:hypothetical protein
VLLLAVVPVKNYGYFREYGSCGRAALPIGDDGDMSFRIWNYSCLEGMRNRTAKGHVTEIKLVSAIVIYLEPGSSTPDTLSVRITGMDGTSHTFTYPTLKLLDYMVEELEERGLSILLPFYLLKLRKRVQAARTPEKRQELAGEMKYLMEKLTSGLERGAPNKRARRALRWRNTAWRSAWYAPCFHRCAKALA